MKRKNIVFTVILFGFLIALVVLVCNILNVFGNNQCEVDGVMYDEFADHPTKDCQCRGFSDGYEKAIWVCRGGVTPSL